MKTVRIGNGQAFWGDDVGAPLKLISTTSLDYIVMDFLAEITMSILQKQRRRNPEAGYAIDAVQILAEVLPVAIERGTKVVTNAGGVNPVGCANAVRAMAEQAGIADQVKIAVITGDDLMDQLDELVASGELTNMDSGESITTIADRVLSANAYLGSAPVRDALATGANVVIAGRITDTALTLGPLMYEHGWAEDDWDKLAAGIVAGHLIECGVQVTGGTHQADWRNVPGLDDLGYPIAEVDAAGGVVITKPEGSGGVVDVQTATEQLLYEIGDPAAYLTPDVSVDWTSIGLEQDGPDRVVVTGCKGSPAPPSLKVSVCYRGGYRTSLTWTYTWPDALAKAQAAEQIIRTKVRRIGLDLEADHVDIIGTGAIHGRRLAPPEVEPSEVVLRYAARAQERAPIQRLAIEMAPMALAGPPGLAGFISGGGRGHVTEIGCFWPALISRDRVSFEVTT